MHINRLRHNRQTENMNREDQQDATIRCLLLTSVSTCFGHHYAHLQENKGPVTAFGVLFWFCWMWLVAVVGRCLAGCDHYEGFCSVEQKRSHLQLVSWVAKTCTNIVWREKNHQDATIRCLLLTSISTCFGHHYAIFRRTKNPLLHLVH